jgi:ribosomal-protein-alanine N-acetyltransferase
MNEQYAFEVVNDWHYEGMYSFYDMDADEEDLQIFLDTKYWQYMTFAVLKESNEMVAWVTFFPEDDILWLSLDLKPELTGQGLGTNFVAECIRFAGADSRLKRKYLKLDVACFNERAQKVYKRAGFTISEHVMKKTHCGEIEFLSMTRLFDDLTPLE